MTDQSAGTLSARDILPGSTGAMPPFAAQASPARHSSSGRRENANSSSAGRAPFSRRSLPVAPDRLCRRLRTKRVRIQDRRTRFSGRQSYQGKNTGQGNQARGRHRIRTIVSTFMTDNLLANRAMVANLNHRRNKVSP
jgi:hypothetical protein